MSQLQTKWIADDAVNDQKVKLRNNEWLRARNAADDGDVNVMRLSAANIVELPAGTQIGGEDVATVDQIPSTFNLKGVWNANTNTPTITSGTNTHPSTDYVTYIVNVAGATTIDGQSDWQVGDKIFWVESELQWFKADNNDAVVSVAGKTGTVTLDTDDVAEAANLYFTDARVIAAPLTGLGAPVDSPIAATDTVLEAFEKTQGQINAVASAAVNSFTDVVTLIAADITNGYIDLTHSPVAGSLVVFPKGGLVQVQGDDYEVDAILDDRLNFLGDLASTLVAGDKLVVTYNY